MTRDIQPIIAVLQDDKEPLEAVKISEMSNLTRKEEELLRKVWPEISLDKRRRMITWMSESADDDVQLDFSAVCILGLSDEDAQVRCHCIQGLWEHEHFKLIRPFLTLLRQDPSVEVRASAASGLGRFVLQGEMEYLTQARLQEIVGTLVKTVADQSLSLAIRRRAVESLGYSTDPRVSDIISRAYEDPAEEMRMSAIFAMGRTADEYWSGTVRTELFNDNPAFRFEAVRAAGELGDPIAVNRIGTLLVDEDQDQEIREMAAWALGQIGGPIAKKVLMSVIKEDDPSLRRIARDSLTEMAFFDDENPNMSFFVPDVVEDESEEHQPWEHGTNGYYQDDDDDEYADDEYTDDLYDEDQYYDEEYNDEDWNSDKDWLSLPL
ncbi:MAG: HEAT repeat domain-containing protein [Ardenticatenaceae bacterium]